MILVAVGTFIHGFDALVEAADGAVGELGLSGFAQIGHSRVIPRHLAWERFLSPAALAARIGGAGLVICHGGIGLLGEAMRAGKPIIAMPRSGRPSRASPAGDQTALLRRLAERHPIQVCEHPSALGPALRAMVATGPVRRDYDLGTDIPQLLVRFLSGQ